MRPPPAAATCRWQHPCRGACCPKPRNRQSSNHETGSDAVPAHEASGVVSKPATATTEARRQPEQHADHGERQFDVVAAIEKDPSRQREPRDEADRRSIDVWMKLIEYGSIMGDEFPAHEGPSLLEMMAGIGSAGSASRRSRKRSAALAPTDPCKTATGAPRHWFH